MKRSMGTASLVGMALLLSWMLQSGYVVETLNDATFTHNAWVDFPIVIQIWDGFAASPAIAAGSNPRRALTEALERWARTSSLTIVLGPDSSVTDAGVLDNTNLVTIADTTANKNAVGQGLGLSTKFSEPTTGRIVEVDVILNPASQWSTVEPGPNDPDVNNIFDVALHEFGHDWNLDHSISRSSTMFFQGGGFDFGFNAESWDDVAGLNVTYPMVGIDQVTGSITGTVTRSGSAVFGAFVVAVDSAGRMVANTITLPDGSYNLQFLPPGDYILYAEPLDGPTTTASVTGGVFSAVPMTTDFLPAFYQNSLDPNVTVTAGAATPGIDITVQQGNAALDPTFLGQTVNPNSAFSVASAGTAQMNQEAASNVIVAGDGVDTLSDNQGVFLLPMTAPGLVSGTVSRSGTFTDGTPFKMFPITVPLNQPLGPYTMVLTAGGAERGVMSGGLEVFRPQRFMQAFAQFANLSGITSGLFLVNTDLGAAATGKISARDDPGTRNAIALGSLSSDANQDLDFNLAAGGALSVSTSPGNFVGSVRALADRRIGGTVLFESASGTTGVGASRPLYTFIAPVEVGSCGAAAPPCSIDTGFALAALDEMPTKVFIQVQSASGTLGNTIVDLPGQGHTAAFITQLVSGLPASFEGTAVVTANRQIAATVISVRPGVFTTFPVIQNRIFTSSFFAQFAQAGDLTSELILVNPSPDNTASVKIQVRNSDGTVAAGLVLGGQTLADGSKTVSIPPLAGVRLKTGSDIVGSVEVSTNDFPVGGVVLFSSPSIGTAGVGESFAQTDFVLPISRDTAMGIDTGVALVNTTAATVNVTITVRDATGSQVSQTMVPLGAHQQLAKFPNEAPLSLGLSNSFTGSIWISADGPIGGTVIRVSQPPSPSVLTTFPVIPLSQFITPQ